MSTDSGTSGSHNEGGANDRAVDAGRAGSATGDSGARVDLPPPVVNNVSFDGHSPARLRELDYGPDIVRRKPLDVPGRRGGLILSIVAVLLFGFAPVCLLLSAAAAILSVRALRSIEKGEEGRGMPIVALVLAFLGAAWSALYLLWAIVIA